MSVIAHSEADCTCHFCEAIRTAQASFENLDAYAVRLRRERDEARQELQGAVSLLRELSAKGAGPCNYNDAGWCARHGFQRPCAVERARAIEGQ